MVRVPNAVAYVSHYHHRCNLLIGELIRYGFVKGVNEFVFSLDNFLNDGDLLSPVKFNALKFLRVIRAYGDIPTKLFISSLRVALSNNLEEEILDLSQLIGPRGSCEETYKLYLSTVKSQKDYDKFLQAYFDYPPFSINTFLKDKYYLLDWMSNVDKRIQPSLEYFSAGDILDFITEVIYYRTGENIAEFPSVTASMYHLIYSTFSFPVPGSYPYKQIHSPKVI